MTEWWTNGLATLHQADARALPLPDKSVHCVVTSPPYWGLRDYGLGEWEGGDADCDHANRLYSEKTTMNVGGVEGKYNSTGGGYSWPGGICSKCGARQQAAGIGLEPTLGEWLANIVAVGREVWRVLRDDGTFWLNLGDAYAGSGKGRNAGGRHSDSHGDKQRTNQGAVNGIIQVGRATHANPGEHWNPHGSGLPAKNLMGQPWRAAFALQDDGWILRSAVVWHKPNPMPESVTDRPTNAYEMVFLFSKQGRYFYDAEAVRQGDQQHKMHGYSMRGRLKDPSTAIGAEYIPEDAPYTVGANLRNVWTIPTQGRPEAHFATFPDELPRRCILAGTSAHGVCATCGSPWVRQVSKELVPNVGDSAVYTRKNTRKAVQPNADMADINSAGVVGRYATQTLGWEPTCACDAARVPATVLDPFIGSGTTAAVALSLGRKAVGTDLNPEYLEIARKRIGKADAMPMEML